MNLIPVKEITRNTPLYLAIFFINPANRKSVDASGDEVRVTDVVYRYAVVRPDSTKQFVSKSMVAWDLTTPPSRTMQIVQGRPSINFQVIDPPGIYTIYVVVRDNIRNIDIELHRTVLLKE